MCSEAVGRERHTVISFMRVVTMGIIVENRQSSNLAKETEDSQLEKRNRGKKLLTPTCLARLRVNLPQTFRTKL